MEVGMKIANALATGNKKSQEISKKIRWNENWSYKYWSRWDTKSDLKKR